MGFPVGYTEVFLPNLFVHILSLIGLLRLLILTLLRLLHLSHFLESEFEFSHPDTTNPTRPQPGPSAALIREFLPVAKFDLSGSGDGDAPESCAVCLYEFEDGEEIRWMANCRHVFHRGCVDRWMDCDQKTCPLCRTPLVPIGMRWEFNQRLWAACDASSGFSGEYSSNITGL